MKFLRAASVFSLSLLFSLNSSCLFSSDETAYSTVRLTLTDASSFDCFALNVVGPNIGSFDQRYRPLDPAQSANQTSHCTYPGASERIKPAVVGVNELFVRVPIGSPRLIQVWGFNTSGQGCPAMMFNEFWRKKIDDASDVSSIDAYEVGRAKIDIPPGTRDKVVEILGDSNYSSKKLTQSDCPPVSEGGTSLFRFENFPTSIGATRKLAGAVLNANSTYTMTITPPGTAAINLNSPDYAYTFAVTGPHLIELTDAGGQRASGQVDVVPLKNQNSSLFLWGTADNFPNPMPANVPPWTNLASGPISSLGPSNYDFALNTSGGINSYPSVYTSTTPFATNRFFTNNTLTQDTQDFIGNFVYKTGLGDHTVFCFTNSPGDDCVMVGAATHYIALKQNATAGKFTLELCLGCQVSITPLISIDAPIPADTNFHLHTFKRLNNSLTYTIDGMGPAALSVPTLPLSYSSSGPDLIYVSPTNTGAITEFALQAISGSIPGGEQNSVCVYLKQKYKTAWNCP